MSRDRLNDDESTPEHWLEKAIEAGSVSEREEFAQRGLSLVGADVTTRSLLMRQLHLALMERGEFAAALGVAEGMVKLGVLVDVCCHHVALAHLALGSLDDAMRSWQQAVDVSTPWRRAFHLWTLGSALYCAGHLEAADVALARAVTHAESVLPLFEAHLALVRFDRGALDGVELDDVISELSGDSGAGGYGQFVLGMLCARRGRDAEAVEYLRSFVSPSAGRGKLASLALSAELAMAEAQLGELLGKPTA